MHAVSNKLLPNLQRPAPSPQLHTHSRFRFLCHCAAAACLKPSPLHH